MTVTESDRLQPSTAAPRPGWPASLWAPLSERRAWRVVHAALLVGVGVTVMGGWRVAALAVLMLAVVLALHHSGRRALAKAVTSRIAAPWAVGSMVGLAVHAVG